MRKIAIILVVAFGLCEAAELGLDGLGPNELKEIEKEIAAGNVPPNYAAEKPKRGAKLTNPDNSNFNQLNSVNSIKPQVAVRPQQTPIQQPYRYVYTQPTYIPQNPYLQYFQNPSQLSYQPAAVPHYLQTPTQVQYVSNPAYSSLSTPAFKSLNTKPASDQTQKDQSALSPQQPATPQLANPYYQPQQYVMLLVSPHNQPHQAPVLYPGYQQQQFQQQMYLLGQNPYLGLYSQQQQRLGLQYNPAAGQQQVTYLTVPGAQQGVPVTGISDVSSDSQKGASLQQPGQELPSSNAYGVRTKA